MKRLPTIVAALLLALPVMAQQRHDPLNNKEIDQLRDTAQQPEDRIKLLVKFARARLEQVDKLRATPGTADRTLAAQLDDFTDLIDELDVNLDSYNRSSADLRKPLHAVIAADTEFKVKLRAMAQELPEGVKTDFAIALESALDSVTTSGGNARAMLAQQLERKGQEKVEIDKKPTQKKPADVKPPEPPAPMSEKPPY